MREFSVTFRTGGLRKRKENNNSLVVRLHFCNMFFITGDHNRKRYESDHDPR